MVIDDAILKQSRGYYKPRAFEYHVTSLLGCPRHAILKHLLGSYAKPLNLWKMFVGTSLHTTAEDFPPGDVLQELQLSSDFVAENGVECRVVGRFDIFYKKRKMLGDWKFVWDTRYIPNDKHFRQMAMYEVMARRQFNVESWARGGAQVNYVLARTGEFRPYMIQGNRWVELVDEMEKDLPYRLKLYTDAEQDGIIPNGDPAYEECNYCSPEYKACCKTKGKEDRIGSLRMFVNSYRENENKNLEKFI